MPSEISLNGRKGRQSPQWPLQKTFVSWAKSRLPPFVRSHPMGHSTLPIFAPRWTVGISQPGTVERILRPPAKDCTLVLSRPLHNRPVTNLLAPQDLSLTNDVLSTLPIYVTVYELSILVASIRNSTASNINLTIPTANHLTFEW
jgi:hypothetical protein